jgi:hypothetical protein
MRILAQTTLFLSVGVLGCSGESLRGTSHPTSVVNSAVPAAAVSTEMNPTVPPPSASAVPSSSASVAPPSDIAPPKTSNQERTTELWIDTRTDGLLGVEPEPGDNDHLPVQAGFGPPAGSNAQFGMVNLTNPTSSNPSSAHGTTIVRIGSVRREGTLPMEVVQRILRQNYGLFSDCYREALDRKPRLQGTVELVFNIDGQGAVFGARVGKNEIDDPKMSQCVVNGVPKLRFPAPVKPPETVSFSATFLRQRSTKTAK